MLAPGSNDLGQLLKNGYAADGVNEYLLKLDLNALKPIKFISLSDYHCVPMSAVFLHIGIVTRLVTDSFLVSFIIWPQYSELVDAFHLNQVQNTPGLWSGTKSPRS